jgi:hypothetical protein
VQNPWQTPHASIGESVLPQSCFTPQQFSQDKFLKILT